MREVFVDTSFFVAILNPKDRLQPRAASVARALAGVRLVTTDGVLTEVLNYFAEWGIAQRGAASQAVRKTRGSGATIVIPQTAIRCGSWRTVASTTCCHPISTSPRPGSGPSWPRSRPPGPRGGGHGLGARDGGARRKTPLKSGVRGRRWGLG
jgi:hypothetical protein